MLTRSDYLEWITRHYSQAVCNLAASGVPALPVAELWSMAPCWGADPVGELAAELASWQGLPRAELLPCNGTSQALWLAYAATLGPGVEALVESPAYAPFADSAATLGAILRRFPRSAADGYALDAGIVCRLLTPRTRVVALSSLHNPSGRAAAPAAICEIAAALARQDGYVIVNEAYAPFGDGASTAWRSCRHLAENVICVASLSKAFGLGPQRIGWLSGPEAVVARAAHAQLASTGDLPVAWGSAALSALQHLPELAQRAVRLAGDKRQRVESWLSVRSWLGWSRPAGGLFGLVTVPGDVNTMAFAHDAVARHGVLVVPGEFFAAPSSFRLAWACPTDQLDAGLIALGAALADSGFPY